MYERYGACRPKCPFFGFHWPERGCNLVDTGNNECGLDLTDHGPCKMASEYDHADYFHCDLPLQTRNLLEAGRRYIRFYPAELSGNGIGFEAWRDLTTRE